MAEKTTKTRHGGPRPNSGRPDGAATTETSDLVSRLLARRGVTQKTLAEELALPYSTFRRYLRENLLPTTGAARRVILDAARREGLNP